MDDIIIFTQKEKELETLIQVIGIFSQNIGIEYIIEKCTITDVIKLTNQENIMKKKKKTQNTGKH